MSTVAELVSSLSAIMNSQQAVLAATAASEGEEVIALLGDAWAATEAAAGLIINCLGETPLSSREDVATLSVILAPLAETARWPAHAAILSARVAEAFLALSLPAAATV
ncbi:MAG: hypothetical protein LWW93_12005 [Hyphomicrobiales bacterium]|nr:hypothetical protein [Hyphomicrobiales bacterium]